MSNITTLKAAIEATSSDIANSTYDAGQRLATAETTTWNATVSAFAGAKVSIESADKKTIMLEYYKFLVDSLEAKRLAKVGQKTYKEKTSYVFRSADATRNAWKYATVVAACSARGNTFEAMFEADELKGKLPSKKYLEGLNKDKKTNLEKLQHLAKTADTILTAMAGDSKADKNTAQDIIQALLITAGKL